MGPSITPSIIISQSAPREKSASSLWEAGGLAELGPRREVLEGALETRRDGARCAVADGALFDHDDRRELAHGARREDLVGAQELGERDALDVAGDAEVGRDAVDEEPPRDARQAVVGVGRQQDAVAHGEEVGAIRLGDVALDVEHDRVGRAGGVGGDFGEDVVDEVVVMDFGVEALRRVAPRRRDGEFDAPRVVVRRDRDGRLVLGEHDERRAEHVELGVHRGRRLDAARERQPDVRVVGHAVGEERLEQRVSDLALGMRVAKVEDLGRFGEPVEVGLEHEHAAALVDAQALPARVAALDGRVERIHRREAPRDESAAAGGADPHEDVGVARVGHEFLCGGVVEGGCQRR
mmetsp:Transcript_7538/g.31195  ORF Transcript_7538/g.31195 Transcript_7538/m.31195 type:complete len:351 (-) Transcript_7538:205-1257(-)